jgi:N-methylhydantoinase A
MSVSRGNDPAGKLPDAFLSLSVDVLPQKREYERTSTTVINAYVGPPVRAISRAMIDAISKDGVAAG